MAAFLAKWRRGLVALGLPLAAIGATVGFFASTLHTTEPVSVSDAVAKLEPTSQIALKLDGEIDLAKLSRALGQKVVDTVDLGNGWVSVRFETALDGIDLNDVEVRIAANRSISAADTQAFSPQQIEFAEFSDDVALLNADLLAEIASASVADEAVAAFGSSQASVSDSTTGAGVTVAVIDTGITQHPALDGAVLPGYDFVSAGQELVRDSNGVRVSFDGDYI